MRFLNFIGGRLLRAVISLLLFQIILFSLIQALPQDYAELKIAVFSQEDLSQFEGALGEDPGLGAEISLGEELPPADEGPGAGPELALGEEPTLGEEPQLEVELPPDTATPTREANGIVQQFINWMVRFYRGDLGTSANPKKGAVADILQSLCSFCFQRLSSDLCLVYG
jgi:ABC-type dipeptide/oligopeptide/nickel transport system permease component